MKRAKEDSRNDTFRMTLSSNNLNVMTSSRTRPHPMSNGTGESSEIGEVRDNVNGVEVARNLAVRLVGEGRVKDGETW